MIIEKGYKFFSQLVRNVPPFIILVVINCKLIALLLSSGLKDKILFTGYVSEDD